MIKIALVDDHIILRRSLGMLIRMLGDYTIVFEAKNGVDCMNKMRTCKKIPDIVVLDITMDGMDGMDTARWFKQTYPRIRILVVSILRNELIVVRMLKNGASGFLAKDCETEELRVALEKLSEGEYYYNELLTPKMTAKGYNPNMVLINSQELCFMRFACTELTHKEIADQMRVSPRTIDGYRDSLFKKLKVSSRVGIVIYALKNELVRL